MDDLPNLQELKKEESIFDSLQKNALETIRELSGQLWTDHAPHDPGITTLDILNSVSYTHLTLPTKRIV